MKFRRMAVAIILSLSLVFGGIAAFAASLEDTEGLPGEMSINKLVALQVFNSKDTFRPEDPLTRGDLAYSLAQVLNLAAPKSITIKDLSTKNGANARVAKVVGNGYMKLDAKGNFNANKGVTYAELSRSLALGLGLKSSWTDRPIDFLFYLERRGVLDIDTDLDEVVTREAAAVAIDKFIALKGTFRSDQGVVTEVKPDSIVMNNGVENVSYKFSSPAALFMSGQSDEVSTFGPGTFVEIVFNAKGEIAFMSGSSLALEAGEIVYTDGKVSVNKTLRNIDLRAVIMPLPNAPKGLFTLSSFGGYSGAGATFGGEAYINNANDEVTFLEVYMAKAEDRPFTVRGSTITLDFSEDGLNNQSFTAAEEIAITLASDADKTLTLSQLGALQASNTLTGTFEMNEAGEVKSIKVTAEPKQE